MLTRPTFAPHYRVHRDVRALVLVSAGDPVVLEGPVCRLMAPYLNGAYTADEVVARLDGQVPKADAFYALLMMEKAGYLLEADAAILPDAARWTSLGVHPAAARRRLAGFSVSVRSFAGPAPAALTALLDAHGLPWHKAGTVELVLVDDYLHPALRAYNRDAQQARRPYMLVKPTGPHLRVGPCIVPGQTACWACLAHRLLLNQPAADLEAANGTHAPPEPSYGPSAESIAFGLAVEELVKWAVQSPYRRLEGRLVALDLRTLQSSPHPVTRRPQCPACGDPARELRARPARLHLTARPKHHRAGGAHRSVHPADTLAAYEHHVSPITGVVRSLEPVVTHHAPFIHNTTAGHALQIRGNPVHRLRKNRRDHSGGKGRTALQARASGLCEALERYSSVFQGTEPVRIARAGELDAPAVRPGDLLLFSAHQYATRDAWNASNRDAFQEVFEPFEAHTPIAWSPAWSLTHDALRYVPTAHAFFGFDGAGAAYCTADSNGLAAGNSLEEAALQGFLELVERDSVALWWYNRTRHPSVDLAGFDDPYLHALTDAYRSIGRDLWALDVTSDLGIPSFVAVSPRVDSPKEEILLGFGAHFDPRVGLLRAVLEVNQSLPYVLRSRRERTGALQADHPTALAWWDQATVANQPYLRPAPGRPARTLSDYPVLASDDLATDLHYCTELMARTRMDLIVMDQTRADVGLTVVKVFVPGLRHFWKRLGPGRLYDAPVQLGRLPHPLDEDEMNPWPLFL